MTWLFIGVFIVGALFWNAGRGTDDKRQKRFYYCVSGGLYILLLILANTIL